MNPQPSRQSAIKTVRVMARITERTLFPKKVSPNQPDVTETPLTKSGAIRQEFISVA